jgi:hypothetical protein
MDKQRSAMVAAIGLGALVAAIAVRKLWAERERQEFKEKRDEARDRLLSLATTHEEDRKPAPKKRATRPPKKIDAV